MRTVSWPTSSRLPCSGLAVGTSTLNAGSQPYDLFSEVVKVTPACVYLSVGTIYIVTKDGISWKDHVDAAIAKAQRRSTDLACCGCAGAPRASDSTAHCGHALAIAGMPPPP